MLDTNIKREQRVLETIHQSKNDRGLIDKTTKKEEEDWISNYASVVRFSLLKTLYNFLCWNLNH